MGSIVTLLVVVAIIAGVFWLVRQQQATKARELDDAKADARRWVERLGGQVLNLVGTNDAAKQALADAAERYTAAGSQIDQARSAAQARGVTETAYEGLYYVRAARTAMDLDPGPELPPLPGQQRAGAVTEAREVEVQGHSYGASPNPTGRNTHYYPGGMVAGRPGPARLVLRAVVASRAGRRRLGPGLGPAVHLAVQRHVRRGLRRRVRRRRGRRRHGRRHGRRRRGWRRRRRRRRAATSAAATSAATSAAATSSDPPRIDQRPERACGPPLRPARWHVPGPVGSLPEHGTRAEGPAAAALSGERGRCQDGSVTDRLPEAGGHARGGGPALLERGPVLDDLLEAVAAAGTGRGGAALVTGEAGIGKTSVVRALRASLDHGVRVLAGACDDLLSPRALGPLREAAAGTTGPLAAALAGDQPDAVPGAAVAELAAWRPTVLIVEDLHWADDATLDVLGHVARRLADLPALLVLTFRDEEVPPAHPVRRVLGALTAAPVHRLALAPLSPAAVAGLAAGSGRDSAALHALTGGNPFYVTEALAAPGVAVPATVADAVLARVGRLDAACRDAVEQLSVVPTAVELGLARQLLGERFDALAQAEEQGVLQVRDDGLAFRHELARRAVEQSLLRAAPARAAPAGGRGAARGGVPRPPPARPPRRPGR